MITTWNAYVDIWKDALSVCYLPYRYFNYMIFFLAFFFFLVVALVIFFFFGNIRWKLCVNKKGVFWLKVFKLAVGDWIALLWCLANMERINRTGCRQRPSLLVRTASWQRHPSDLCTLEALLPCGHRGTPKLRARPAAQVGIRPQQKGSRGIALFLFCLVFQVCSIVSVFCFEC